MVILALILIPITSVITGILVFLAYKEGLKHNWELKNNIEPSNFTKETKKEVKPVEAQDSSMQKLLDEWINGAEKK